MIEVNKVSFQHLSPASDALQTFKMKVECMSQKKCFWQMYTYVNFHNFLCVIKVIQFVI